MNLFKPKHRFRPTQRLLNQQQFNRVFAEPTVRAAIPEVLVLASERSSNETVMGPRLGFIVAKKKIRHAVNRNHFKRIFREHFRHLSAEFPALDLVVLARVGAQHLDTAALHHSADKLFAKIQRKYSDCQNNRLS